MSFIILYIFLNYTNLVALERERRAEGRPIARRYCDISSVAAIAVDNAWR